MNNLLKKNWFWLAAILTSGLILRLYLMSMLKCLTFDEIDSVSETNRPLGQIWSYIKWEMHPPLHFYYLHFWISAFGSSETALHWSSLVLSLAAIIVLYFLGKEIFKSSIAGLAAAVLYAWSSLFCFYGDWARMTTMLFLFAALSFLFFFKLLKARGRKIILFGALFTFFTLGALYTHLTAGLVPAIEFFYLLYLFFRRQNSSAEICKKFLAPALLILAGYAPWFWYFWQAKLKILGGNAWYFTAQGKTSLPYIVIYDCLKYLTPFESYFLTALALVLLVILAFFALAVVNWREGKKLKIKIFFSPDEIFPLLILLVSFAGLYFSGMIVLRYAIIPAIGLFLLLGYGFSRMDNNLRAAVFLLFLFLSIISFKSFTPDLFMITDWKGAANFISQNQKSGDKIVTSLYSNILPFDYYYRGGLPIAAPLDKKFQGDDLLRTVIKTNIYPTTNQNNVGQLKNFISGTNRVFFAISDGLGAFPGSHKIVENWLEGQGFVRVQFWPSDNASTSLIWIMEKN